MELIRIDPKAVPNDVIARAASVLCKGGLVAFPTETVYGIGALAEHDRAVRRLYEVKCRPSHKPLTHHIASAEDVKRYLDPIPEMGRRLMDKYWPGPLTLVFDRPNADPIGFRYPANAVAQDLIRASGAPVVATSANTSGEEPAVTGEEVARTFDDRIDVVIDTGPTELRQASTVVRIGPYHWEILREGFIDERMIRAHLLRKLLFVCTGNTCRSVMAEHLCRRILMERFDVPEEKIGQCGFQVLSAGTLAFYGGTASPNAVEVMRGFGCDISGHVTRPLSLDMVLEAAHLYVMTQDQKRLVESLAPEAIGKLSLLHPEGKDIEDPFGKSSDSYLRVAREIEEALRRTEGIGR